MFYNIINMKILITSGGTRVPIDSVRSITNMSKGTYGKNLLVECVNELQFRKIPPTGVEIIFLHAKGSAVPEIDLNMDRQVKVTYIEFDTYQDYHDIAVEIVSEDMPSVIVSAAAVSDYTVVPFKGKMSSNENVTLELIKTEKVLPRLKNLLLGQSCCIIGFKLMVSPSYGMVYDAVKKVLDEGADYVVCNDLTELRKGNSKRLLFDRDMKHREIENVVTLAKFVIDQCELMCF